MAILLEAGVREGSELLFELRCTEGKAVPGVIPFCTDVVDVVREEGKDDREVCRSRKVLELAAVSFVGDL